MRYYALASDYDGTLATHGKVDDTTINALERLKNSGRKLILVTGRELDELMEVFPHIGLFDLVVAENGALIYNPVTKAEVLLCERPPDEFLRQMHKRGVSPFSVGRVIVATWKPHENTVLEIIRDLGLELQVIFNKEAVMVLPSGVNKATGLKKALEMLGLSAHNVASVGDAENDHAFLKMSEFACVVDNALPSLKDYADYISPKDHGAGVTDLIEKILDNDLREFEERLARYEIILGMRTDGKEMRIKPYGTNVLVAGPSGGGKSSLATAFMEKLNESAYQFCLIDPEGDYENFLNILMIGGGKQIPKVEEVIKVLEKPGEDCVVSFVGVPFDSRPSYFEKLLPALMELRSKTGRPHWIVVDEAHHLLPLAWTPASVSLPGEMRGMLYVTLKPDHVAPAVLSSVDIVVAIGDNPGEIFRSFCSITGEKVPVTKYTKLEKGEALAWLRRDGMEPVKFNIYPPAAERDRHKLKYMEGELGPDRSFYFRGPEGKLNLRAQNLQIFLQMSEGVDDDTWQFHLNRGDYANWFREFIKDEELADEAVKIKEMKEKSPKESRELIRNIIQERYTGPA